MTKKQIKQLAEGSFKQNYLDAQKVSRIMKIIDKKKDIKEYIRYLKLFDDRRKVVISLPNLADQKNVTRSFSKVFPKKRIIIVEDPGLVAGLKVKNGDEIFDYNLKNTLDSINDFINNEND